MHPDCEKMKIPVDVINEFNQSRMPIHNLRNKTGSIIMCLRNINPFIGLCNGTRLKVIGLNENLIIGEIINGKFKNQVVQIFRIKFFSDENQTVKFIRIHNSQFHYVLQ